MHACHVAQIIKGTYRGKLPFVKKPQKMLKKVLKLLRSELNHNGLKSAESGDIVLIPWGILANSVNLIPL